MPPRKKTAHKLLLNLTPFEEALLRYLGHVTQRPMGVLLRDALRVFARQHQQFNPTTFVQYVKGEELLSVESFKREVELFVAGALREPSSTLDPITAIPDPGIAFDGDADFR